MVIQLKLGVKPSCGCNVIYDNNNIFVVNLSAFTVEDETDPNDFKPSS